MPFSVAILPAVTYEVPNISIASDNKALLMHFYGMSMRGMYYGPFLAILLWKVYEENGHTVETLSIFISGTVQMFIFVHNLFDDKAYIEVPRSRRLC